MYGGNAAGVDLILHEYLALWAFVVDRETEFDRAWHQQLEQQNCGSANFSTRYLMDHPSATDKQTVEHVVRCWQKITKTLQMSIAESTVEHDATPAPGPSHRVV
jgi:hypothetical protein